MPQRLTTRPIMTNSGTVAKASSVIELAMAWPSRLSASSKLPLSSNTPATEIMPSATAICTPP